jgi:2-hydroxychromene-2-carboxylate isomerase
MGQLIVLRDRVRERLALRLESPRPAFYFDLACPYSYLAAERVERLLGQVDWIPVHGAALRQDRSIGPEAAVRAEATARAEATERAAALRLPLVWPDRYPFVAPRALRAAAYASTAGAGARFALAALRLAFCGGFDLDAPGALAEAASAAGIPRRRCLEAAGDERLDATLDATARGLRRRGVRRLPAIRVGDRWFEGEPALLGAAAMRREAARGERAAGLRAAGLPLAPSA